MTILLSDPYDPSSSFQKQISQVLSKKTISKLIIAKGMNGAVFKSVLVDDSARHIRVKPKSTSYDMSTNVLRQTCIVESDTIDSRSESITVTATVEDRAMREADASDICGQVAENVAHEMMDAMTDKIFTKVDHLITVEQSVRSLVHQKLLGGDWTAQMVAAASLMGDRAPKNAFNMFRNSSTADQPTYYVRRAGDYSASLNDLWIVAAISSVDYRCIAQPNMMRYRYAATLRYGLFVETGLTGIRVSQVKLT